VCPDLHPIRLALDVRGAFDAATAAAERAGATLVEVALPEARGAYETFGVIQRAEALRVHTETGLFPERRAEYDDDVRSRLELAQTETPDDYIRATVARERLRAAFAGVLAEVDFMLTPVCAGSPPLIGEDRVVHLGGELDFRELVMSFTVPQDLTGLPACTFRAGFDDLGIPVGVQLTGPPWSERRILGAVQALFNETADIQSRWPQLPEARGR
jgi:aspartyl-tRNA(Asn)/glutamyl-tRNA(Gln) amidotransferase subunit A